MLRKSGKDGSAVAFSDVRLQVKDDTEKVSKAFETQLTDGPNCPRSTGGVFSPSLQPRLRCLSPRHPRCPD